METARAIDVGRRACELLSPLLKKDAVIRSGIRAPRSWMVLLVGYRPCGLRVTSKYVETATTTYNSALGLQQ